MVLSMTGRSNVLLKADPTLKVAQNAHCVAPPFEAPSHQAATGHGPVVTLCTSNCTQNGPRKQKFTPVFLISAF